MIQRATLFCALLLLIVAEACIRETADSRSNGQVASLAVNSEGSLLKDIPKKIDVDAEYLFYLHGRIIEEQGVRPVSERYGVYEYQQILETFKSRGFTVISEARAKGTGVKQYATKVVEQIRRLLEATVPPHKITVVGASKGGVIAMLASSFLKNKAVNFVLMCNCNDYVLENYAVDLHGNVLSIYDAADEIGQSCDKFFKSAGGLNKYEEIELRTGLGHGILYRPMGEWVDAVVRWARSD
ncbi:alpha/beta hydrolase [bacterium]|nr:alpha/beta hydrolase [bacterium]